MEQWKSLDHDLQLEVLEQIEYKTENKDIVVLESESISLDELDSLDRPLKVGEGYGDKDQTLSKGFTYWAKAMMEKNYDEHVGDVDNQAELVTTVGAPELSITFYLFKDKILGAKFNFFQNGAASEDEMWGDHYDTPEEAEADGWDTGADVSWSNNFTINQAGEYLTSNGYWEWTGW